MPEKKIQEIRRRIDTIDENLGELISERARLALAAGEVKGREPGVEFFRPEREAQILRSVVARNQGPLDNEQLVRLQRALITKGRTSIAT